MAKSEQGGKSSDRSTIHGFVRILKDILQDDAYVAKLPTVNGVEVDMFRSREVQADDDVSDGICLLAVGENGLTTYTLSRQVQSDGRFFLAPTQNVTIDTDSGVPFVDPDTLTLNGVLNVLSSASTAEYTSRVKESFDFSDTLLKNVNNELSAIRSSSGCQKSVFVRCISEIGTVVLPWYNAKVCFKRSNIFTRLCNTGKLQWSAERIKDNSVEIYLDWKEICTMIENELEIKPGGEYIFRVNEQHAPHIDKAVSEELPTLLQENTPPAIPFGSRCNSMRIAFVWVLTTEKHLPVNCCNTTYLL